MTRPTLADTVATLAGSVLPAPDTPLGLRVGEVAVDLPVEITLRRRGDDFDVLAHPPRWRWTTQFDQEPGRLSFRCRAEVPG